VALVDRRRGHHARDDGSGDHQWLSRDQKLAQQGPRKPLRQHLVQDVEKALLEHRGDDDEDK
jgi:hypothetical protein